jgi:hypothetical protein
MAIGIATAIVSQKRTILPHDRSPANQVARLAIYVATGKRIRELPISRADLGKQSSLVAFLSQPLRILVGAIEVVAGLIHFKLAQLGSLCGFR